MVVGSVLLVIAAGVLLVFGLVRMDAPMLYSSIGLSAVAALALAVGVRRLATVRAERGVIAVRPVAFPPRPTGRSGPRLVGPAPVGVPPRELGAGPGDRASGHGGRADAGRVDGGGAPEAVSAADLARIARIEATVVVVDGRPWFHLVGCGSGAGSPTEPVPVAQAMELGFTPCGRCRPVATLVTELGDADAGEASALT